MSSGAPSSPPRSRAGLYWALVGVGGVVALGGVLALLVTILLSLIGGNAMGDTTDYPADRFTADCGEPCFTLDDAVTLAPNDDTLAIVGSPDRISSTRELGDDWTVEGDAFGAFYLADGDPQACIFATTTAPLAPQTQSMGWAKNPILDLGAASNSDVTVTQVARVYLQNLDAQRYPTMIGSVLARCPQFTIEVDGVVSPVIVTPTDLDSGVQGVESVAWIETWPEHTSTVVDLRYGTIVVRTEVTRTAGSTVTDAQISDLVADTARRLAALG